jgi:predicted metal-binding protein
MAKIGIIRCQEQSERCGGYSCFPAIRNKSGTFAAYDVVELVGFETCGGCGRGKSDKIVAKAQRLKERGAEVIHLGTCLIGNCPWKELYVKEVAEKVSIPVIERTHAPGPPPPKAAAR